MGFNSNYQESLDYKVFNGKSFFISHQEIVPDISGSSWLKMSIKNKTEFNTYPLLRMVGDESTESSLHGRMVLEFNNQLDFKTFRPEMVTISPPIPSAQITVWQNQILIDGKKPYVPVYTVTVSGDLTDQSGQRLEQPVSRQFKIRLAQPDIHFDYGVITTFDPGGLHQLNVYSQNIQTLNKTTSTFSVLEGRSLASPIWF